MRSRGIGKAAAAAVSIAIVSVLLLGVGIAQAAFGITEANVSLSEGGSPSVQAGAHPDLRVGVHIGTKAGPAGQPVTDGSMRDVKVTLPPGLVGNAAAFQKCPFAKLVGGGVFAECPVGSQVGIVRVFYMERGGGIGTEQEPVYNVESPADSAASFAFNHTGEVVRIESGVRPGDYAVTSTSPKISQGIPLTGFELTLWGVPGDASHDPDRYHIDLSHGIFEIGVASPAIPVPFLSNPTSCAGVPSGFDIEADPWEEVGVFSALRLEEDGEGNSFSMQGCERLSFAPKVNVEPNARRADSPLGLDVHIEVPQSNTPNGLATADVKTTTVTFPKGVAISASAAGGQSACTEAQIGIGSNDAPTCPDSSRLGSVTIKTPLLSEPLEGSVYLATQKANPFGSNFALYVAAKGPGFYIKLPGKVEADPTTGQVTASFDDQPQLPYESVDLKLRGGPQAPLVAPSTCGTYATTVEITSWASPTPVELESPLRITEGCGVGGFSPTLKAGTASPTAGSFSPFTLRVTQQEGEADLSRITATLPPGLLAKLAGVPLCGDAQAASGDCPAGSQVGTTTVGAGPGPNPVYVPEAGKAPTAVYLAGPYKGAPYSLVVKVPAQAGPFDLGTVVVRNALHIDPTTTQVTAESDPLPQILEGVPVSYRDVRVEINRPEFTLNPTNCSRFAVTSVLTSAAGQTAGPQAPFAAANCRALGFAPSLALRLSGAPTRRGANPALTATLKPLKGDANLAKASVVLPPTELLEQGHIRTTCTRAQFAAGSCPKGSIYGKAKAWTPLLDRPLEGPVYLRSNGGERQLPDLVADLDGQIHVVLVGYIDSVKRGGSPRIRTRFVSVPDAPVSKFVLEMQGGKKSLLVNDTNLCKAQPHAEVALTGQNQKTDDTEPLVGVAGCGKGSGQKAK